MRRLVRQLAEDGITILLSSHLLYEVEELCNRVAIIRSGHIVYQGELQDLLARAASSYLLRATEPERAAAICGGQTGIDGVTTLNGEVRFVGDEEAVAAL